MKTPFHLLDKYVYPSLRRYLVSLLYSRGLSVSEISRITGYSKSLVTRYIKGERGGYIDVSRYPDIVGEIEKIIHDILFNKINQVEIEARLMKTAVDMMRKKYLCQYHELLDPSIDIGKCNICVKIFS